MISFKNKKIIIVGGLGLIGKTTVKILLSLGGKVFCIDNQNLKKTNNFNNKNFTYYKADISRPKNYKILKKIFIKCPDPDIYINCSYPRDKDFNENNFKQVNYKNYDKHIKKHLNSYVWLSKIVADKMAGKKKGGSIINLSSIYGLISQDLDLYENTPLKENMTYCIIKSGIIGHTKMLASYYGKFGIRANCVCPGGVIRGDKFSNKIMNKNFKKKYFKKLAIKRFAYPIDVANAIIFLASDNSKYITGVALPVDGGFTSI